MSRIRRIFPERIEWYKKAYLGGTFDIPHVGHLQLIQKVLCFSDKVILSLNTDEFCERFKRKPIMSLKERMEFWWNIKAMDEKLDDSIILWVNRGGEDSAISILESGADVIVHGDDWTGDAYLKQLGIDRAWMKKHNIALKYVPYSKLMSTSEIINRCKKR